MLLSQYCGSSDVAGPIVLGLKEVCVSSQDTAAADLSQSGGGKTPALSAGTRGEEGGSREGPSRAAGRGVHWNGGPAASGDTWDRGRAKELGYEYMMYYKSIPFFFSARFFSEAYVIPIQNEYI